MRHVTEQGLELVKVFERFEPSVYICPAGYPTIGFGHVVLKGESFGEISEDRAEEILANDLLKAERAVLRLIRVPLSDSMFDALCSFTFNVGGGALQRSSLRAALNRGDYEAAADNFMRWVWAGGRKLRGLVRRRTAERNMFLMEGI